MSESDARVDIVARAMVDRNQRVDAVIRAKRFDRRIQTRGGLSVIQTVSNSVLRKDGQTSSRTRQMRGAMHLDVSG